MACLDPTSWRGQADPARVLGSGTNFVMLANEKGDDTYYTADTSNAQLKSALPTLRHQHHRIRTQDKTMQTAKAAAAGRHDSDGTESAEKDTRSRRRETHPPLGDIVTMQQI